MPWPTESGTSSPKPAPVHQKRHFRVYNWSCCLARTGSKSEETPVVNSPDIDRPSHGSPCVQRLKPSPDTTMMFDFEIQTHRRFRCDRESLPFLVPNSDRSPLPTSGNSCRTSSIVSSHCCWNAAADAQDLARRACSARHARETARFSLPRRFPASSRSASAPNSAHGPASGIASVSPVKSGSAIAQLSSICNVPG